MPSSQEFRQRFGRMAHSSFLYHYARLIEVMYGLEPCSLLLQQPDILDTHVRAEAGVNALEGVGMIEAPRGTLIHHYKVDENGAIVWANLIVATGHNNLAINRGVRQVAEHFIDGDKLEEGMLNRVSAVVRAYDPCLSCSTHAVHHPGPSSLQRRESSRRSFAVGQTIAFRGLSSRPKVQQVDRRQKPIVCPTSAPRRPLRSQATSRRLSTLHAGVRAPRRPPLILGYGNSLRGDDAVGPRLATILGGVAVQQLVPELAERLAAEERVIFIDARTDLRPGEVQMMPVDGESASTHWCSPGSLLRLALEVYGKAPEAILIGIGGESFDLGAPISEAAQQGMEKALAQIRAIT
jgi:hydrogenase maturation protease